MSQNNKKRESDKVIDAFQNQTFKVLETLKVFF
jgi:superfamily II DNA or RNA helicase